MKILSTNKQNQTTTFIVSPNIKDWKQSQESALLFISKKINIPGFRKGHAPLAVVKAKIDPADAINEALKKTVNRLYEELLLDKKFTDLELIEDSQKIEIVKVDEKDVEVSFTFENFPEVTLPKCDSLDLEQFHKKVTSEQVDREIKNFAEKDVMLTSKIGDEIENGDYVVFNYKGSVDGKYFPGGEAKNYQLKIGSGSFIPGFEEKMIGLKRSEEKTIDVRFPKDYHEVSLADKVASFELKIVDIKVADSPLIDDVFAASLKIPQVTTVDKLRAYIMKHLENDSNLKFRTNAIKHIAEHLIKNTKIEFIPKTLIEGEKDRLKREVKQNAKNEKISKQEFEKLEEKLEHNEEFKIEVEKNATKNIKLIIALNKLIENYKIKVETIEITNYLKNLADNYQTSLEEIKRQLGNNIEQIEVHLAQEKLFDHIIEINKK